MANPLFILLRQTSVVSTTTTIGAYVDVYPQVRLYSSTVVSSRWKNLSFYTTAEFPDCLGRANDITYTPFTYTYHVYEGTSYLPQFTQTSENQKNFQINEFSLKPSTTYTVQVIVSTDSSIGEEISSSDSVVVVIGQSGIQADIDSGASQTISRLYAVHLYASNSYDMDYPNNTDLTYSWTYDILLSSNSNCRGFVDNKRSIFTIGNLFLVQDEIYAFTVTVQNSMGLAAQASV